MKRQILLDKAKNLAETTNDPHELMAAIVRLLRQEEEYFSWVGFYLLEGEELVLGPYEGKPTPHTRIPLDQGICGAAAFSGKTIIVDDVKSDPRFIACSLDTRSEIVVPISYQGRILGEIDIDSDAMAAFGRADQKLLESLAEILAPKLADR